MEEEVRLETPNPLTNSKKADILQQCRSYPLFPSSLAVIGRITWNNLTQNFLSNSAANHINSVTMTMEAACSSKSLNT
jgi:hypothetical protein